MAKRQAAQEEAEAPPPVDSGVIDDALEELRQPHTDEERKEALLGWLEQYHPEKIPEQFKEGE